MRLENLYLNFGTSSPEEQLAYVVAYRLKRAEDMAKPIPSRKKKSEKASAAKVVLTEEEKVVMQLLGLKQKDIIALRGITVAEEVEEEETGNLFEDSTFEEEED